MRISAKGRYALAAIIEIARSSQDNNNVAVIAIAQTLGISKIYLEQIFTQLKKGDLLLSVKGSRGGYQLTRSPHQITAWDVLLVVEATLVEPTEAAAAKNALAIEMALKSLVFKPLDRAIQETLSEVTIQQLLDASERQQFEQAYMFNI